LRPVDTYSIVALDRKAGEMGVAVQSHWFSVGSVVTWAEAGVGVVATQAFVEVSYGPLGLALIKERKSPEQALKTLLTIDPRPEVRQVAMLDASGRVVAHTGRSCLPEAGHITGAGFSAQGNIMRNRKVWKAMASSFRRAKGTLAERLLVALESAEAAGGDLRGRQSAALLVVKTTGNGKPWEGKVVDLRVDDNPQPLTELRRLLRIHDAFVHANNGDMMLEKGDTKRALEEYRKSTTAYPENPELRFWQAVTLLNLGKIKEGRAILDSVFRENGDLKTLLRNLPAVGLLKVDEDTMRSLLG
jgi:uncharacterized Ntn-hydrolase superfamily protein